MTYFIVGQIMKFDIQIMKSDIMESPFLMNFDPGYINQRLGTVS